MTRPVTMNSTTLSPNGVAVWMAVRMMTNKATKAAGSKKGPHVAELRLAEPRLGFAQDERGDDLPHARELPAHARPRGRRVENGRPGEAGACRRGTRRSRRR